MWKGGGKGERQRKMWKGGVKRGKTKEDVEGEEKGKDKGRCGRGEEKGKDKGRCGSTTSKNGQICRSKVSSRQPRTLNKENPGSNHIAAFSKL